MAKTKRGKSKKPSASANPKTIFRSISTLELLALGTCLLVGIVYAFKSPGAYQDDDLDRYYLSMRALMEPKLFLDRWSMPLPTLLFALPAKTFGYIGVELLTVLITTATAWFTSRAAKSLGFAHPWFVILLFFFQPIALELCYSALAEPVGALLVALAFYFWYQGKAGPSLWVLGLLPLARIEGVFLLGIFFLAAWRKTTWKDWLIAALPLVIWNGLGFLVHGDALYVLGGGGGRPLNSLGVWHYAKNLIVIAGTAILFFVVWGLGSLGRSQSKAPLLALVVTVLHLIALSLLGWDALPVGRSIGFLRHVLTISPAIALVAGFGFSEWLLGGKRVPSLVLAALWCVAVFFFFSHELIAHSFLGDNRVVWRWMVSLGLLLVGLLLTLLRDRVGLRRVAVAVAAILVLAPSMFVVRPKTLDAEKKAIQRTIDYMVQNNIQNRPTYSNHPWFFFLSGRDRYDLVNTPRLTTENLDTAPVGTLVLWENHYGNRLYGDVEISDLRADPRFRRILELSADRFAVIMFERISP
ncbi:MAG: hypothetical protein HKN21_09530 [Candidatus Eisenbacteria bacterium]|uniref:Glycosyltransferase RgtA/B/C/D-like domain-containing protein n=1 Tax=Eiseniibacteriota bacterium TaxID=2212470 RepID=A0A7Y2E866_UNCEI|nr:hypothetical protein [Candidatus Eisenbacteria bacterium]